MQIFYILVIICTIHKVISECPNACSSHGSCGSFDMCGCYRNWMGNDCSQRMCQFGYAHVDSPLGDLDMSSGKLSDKTQRVIVNSFLYPYGTTEQFPAMQDSALTWLDNTAHAYSECSSKGICDRLTGTCDCFDGYSGSACQRQSCPSDENGLCSGHGVCKSIRAIAFADFNNTYDLWDKDATMGCVCDGGYTGADCSEKMCKWGIDPMYLQDGRTVSVANYTFEFWTADKAGNSEITGTYSLKFTDMVGEAWRTPTLNINSDCDAIQAAIYKIPNKSIKSGVWCYRSTFTRGVTGNRGSDNGQETDTSQNPILNNDRLVFEKYTLVFKDLAGAIPQPSVDIMPPSGDDRPTLVSTTNDLKFAVYKNGFSGENINYISDRCQNVRVTIDDSSSTDAYIKIVPEDSQMVKLLKKCLGDADGDNSNNVEIYNWDYGTVAHPHVVKLLDLTQWSNNAYDTSSTATYSTATSANPAAYVEPITRICDDKNPDEQRYGSGLCSNKNPAAFYVVMVYDPSIGSGTFIAFHDAGRDYDTATKFAVYTTTNTFELTNPNSLAVTSLPNKDDANRDYTNFIHLTNASYAGSTDNSGNTLAADFTGEVSCEHNPANTNGALNCLDKDDRILIIKMPVYDPTVSAFDNDAAASYSARASMMCNPVYPNLYTVKKLWRADLSLEPFLDESPNRLSEQMRNRIMLDSGVNADWESGMDKDYTDPTTIGETNGCGAYIYKMIVNTTSVYIGGGARVASQCSGRGLCNTDSGLCECFAGYTNDNCDTRNPYAD